MYLLLHTLYKGTCIYMLCTLVVCTNLNAPSKSVVARTFAYFFLNRVLYPIVYALDLDIVRTLLWFNGLYACTALSLSAVFPGLIL